MDRVFNFNWILKQSHLIPSTGSDFEYVDNYKYLGVWLDCKLSFQTHIKHLKLNLEFASYFANKASFTHAAKHTLVKLTILPILDFDDVIYKIASNTLLYKLDAVYHSAIRFVTKAPYTTHHCDLYALVWLALASYSSPNPLAPCHLQDPARKSPPLSQLAGHHSITHL